MNSLRRAILYRMAGLLLLVGLVSSAATYFYVRDETQITFDAEIRQFATYVDALGSFTQQSKAPAPPAGAEDLFLLQVWDSTGKLTWSSGGPADAVAPREAGYSNSEIAAAHWRSYTLVKPERIIRVSLPLDERNEQASTAALQIAIPMVVVVPLSWLVLSLMIDRIMSRLERAAWAIRSRKPNDPSKVPDEGLPDEVKPFVGSINELVGKLNENVEQQQRFVSDAAHELRTPLTAIGIQISNLETALTTYAQRERIAPLKEGAKRANQLIEQLLQLARAEKGQALQQEPAQLATIFTELQSIFSPIAKDRKIKLAFEHDQPDLLLNKRDAMIVLGALVENAIAYAPPGSRVTVSCRQNTLAVLDEGSGILPEKLPHIFERFYRASSGRVPGTGLGLSIAKAICDQQNWLLRVENRGDRSGVRATLKLKNALA